MRNSILALLGLLALATTAPAADVVIKGATVIGPAGRVLDDVDAVVIRDDKLLYVGAGSGIPELEADAQEIDARGKIVMPGLIDSYTQLGLVEIGMVDATRDMDEDVAPMTPHVHTLDGINAASSLLRVTRLGGVTSALSAPADGNLVGGRSCVVALDGETAGALLRLPHAALHVSLGTPPMRRFGEKKQAPSTRMGEVAMLRAAIVGARDYIEKFARYESKRRTAAAGEEPDPPARDLENEAWLAVLRRERPLFVRAQRASDIEAALRLKEEFDVRVVIVRGAEAWKLAERLAAADVPVVYGPVVQDPRSVETLGARADAPAILHAAGVTLAITTADAHNVRNLPHQAGIAAANGLPLDAALRSITSVPAEILGLQNRIGSLRVGLDADVILLDGDAIQPRTTVERMWIRGREVELTSRQTELAERHR